MPVDLAVGDNTSGNNGLTELKREKVWDPVTRLWHWALVAAVVTGWSLGEFMTFSTIDWHFYAGYCVLGLIVFRLFWGLVGPAPVRLRALLPGIYDTVNYVRHIRARQPSGTPGHNPLGALSVIAMLVVMLAQASTGLFVESDNFFESGPLAYLVTDATSSYLIGWHKLLAKILLALVVLHVSAIIFYLVWKKENLIKPMFTGWKLVRSKSSADDSAQP